MIGNVSQQMDSDLREAETGATNWSIEKGHINWIIVKGGSGI